MDFNFQSCFQNLNQKSWWHIPLNKHISGFHTLPLGAWKSASQVGAEDAIPVLAPPVMIERKGRPRQASVVIATVVEPYGGFHGHGGTPIAGWLRENPEVGVPPFLEDPISPCPELSRERHPPVLLGILWLCCLHSLQLGEMGGCRGSGGTSRMDLSENQGPHSFLHEKGNKRST